MKGIFAIGLLISSALFASNPGTPVNKEIIEIKKRLTAIENGASGIACGEVGGTCRMFTTTTNVYGDMGLSSPDLYGFKLDGLTGRERANEICSREGEKRFGSKRYVAFISDDTMDASELITPGMIWNNGFSNVMVFDSSDLFYTGDVDYSGAPTLAHPIAGREFYTASDDLGKNIADKNCNNWTSKSDTDFTVFGRPIPTKGWFSQYESSCADPTQALPCIEQPAS